MFKRWTWFSDPDNPKRLAAVLVLLAVTAAVLIGMSRLVDFPDGFDDAQSKDSEWLADHRNQLAEWRNAATRDLVVFVPAYTVVGLVALAWAIPRRSVRLSACAFLTAVAVCDLTETWLFRGSLDRLEDGVAGGRPGYPTTITQVATFGKRGFLVLVFCSLAAVVVGQPATADG